MADFLSTRTKSENTILEAQFIRMKLQETANDIDREQRKGMSGFASSFWNDRAFSVTDNEMQLEHLKVHRFVDMRTRTLKDGSKIKKKSHPIHNRIIMGNYSQLTKELAYGFTEEIKNSLRKIQ
jgi:hypothetical protein